MTNDNKPPMFGHTLMFGSTRNDMSGMVSPCPRTS